MEPKDLLLLAGILLLILTMVRLQISSRMAKKSAGTRKQPEPLAPMTPISEGPSKQQQQFEVKLHETFREMNAKLDTKIHILNELIIEAHAAMAKFEELQKKAAADEAKAPPAPAEPPPAPAAVPPPEAGPVQYAAPPPASDEPLVIVMDGPPAKTVESTERPSSFSDVYQLADQGLSSAEIASATGKSIGEIDLILGLRRRRQQAERRF